MAQIRGLVLETERLLLRRLRLRDTDAIHALLYDRDITRMMIDMPDTFDLRWTEEWVESIDASVEYGNAFNFAAQRRADDAIIGCVGIALYTEHLRGEIGYWVGRQFWNQGYATEMVEEMLHFGFEDIGYHRLFATVFAHNGASIRVLEKVGMSYEATLRGSVAKWGQFVDLAYYGIMKDEFE